MRLPSEIDDERLRTLGRFAEIVPPGCFVEVGVFKGGSAQVLYEVAQRQGRTLYLYDTFTGIPFRDEIDLHAIGNFSDCDEASIRAAMPDAVVVKGVFPGSKIDMPPIAFVHSDADQYQSTRDVCLVLGPMMVKGGLMLFDDYRVLQGCIKAVDECFPTRHVLPNDGRALVRFA
jgi:O-methyltransferase